MGARGARSSRVAVVRQHAGTRARGRGGRFRLRAPPPAIPRPDRGVRVGSPRARRERARRPAAGVPVRILRQRRQPARRQHRHDGWRGRIAHHGTVPVAVSLPAVNHAEVGRGHRRQPEALDADPVHAAGGGRGRSVRGGTVRQARARGGGRDGRAPVLVRERAQRATARVLLRDASRRSAHSAAVQAASGGRGILGAAACGVPRALGNSRRGEPLADIDGNGSRPFPVYSEDRRSVAALQAGGPRSRGAPCRGADLPRQRIAAAGRTRGADAHGLVREPGKQTGRALRTHPPRDRGGSPGGRGGRCAVREDFTGYDLRQPGDGDGHERGARAARHEEAPAPRTRPDHGGELLVENRGQTTIFTHMMARRHAFEKVVCPRVFLLAIGALGLAACSATRVAYDNADTVLRFMASSYLDLDAAQSDDLAPRIVRFHRWHRANELPIYAALLRSASQRAAAGITAEDVAWGLANVRLRYRRFAAKAAEDAAPVLATLASAQLAALERKFAENNEKYTKEFLSSDDKERRRRQLKRMLERFRDFAGELAADQEARIGGFALAHERHVALRFEDRQRWQRDFVAALKEERKPEELGRRLAVMFDKPELRRSEEFIREDRRWDEDLGQLIVDLDRSLSVRQRAQVVRRLSDYAEDFAVLAGRRKEAA